MDPSLSVLQRVALWIVPVYLAIVVHELAHGLVASHFGDATAKEQGRLTLNPLSHLHPVGSVIVPAALVMVSQFVFGWAKPVPVNAARLRDPARDMLLVAAAGPASNLLMSILWALAMKAGLGLLPSEPALALILIYAGAAGVVINAAIMMLNLLPVLPLDGGRILHSLLPERYARVYRRTEPWGLPIILLAVLAGIAGQVIWPLMVFAMAIATHIADIPVRALVAALGVLTGQV